jgi:cobalt-zinc-cadmium efflux system protein
MTGSFMIVEVVGGLWTHSLALLADAGHMFADIAALSLSYFAMWMAAKPAPAEKTFGYHRLEILAAVINAVVLLLLSIWILVEAYQRFVAPPEVVGLPMLLIGAVGLGVNIVSMKLLHAHSESSLNVESAYLEVLGDALSSLAVMLAAVVIWATNWTRIDPLISAGISVFIIWRTWRLLGQAMNVLMESAPSHLAVQEVGTAMSHVSGVLSVHDLHIWTITSGLDSLSAHVVVAPGTSRDDVLRALQLLLKTHFAIEHVTLQIVEKAPSQIQVQR